jgi:hypothetical protein
MKRTMIKLIVGGVVTVGTLVFLIPLIDFERSASRFCGGCAMGTAGFLAYTAM